jgi:hypothetical protein
MYVYTPVLGLVYTYTNKVGPAMDVLGGCGIRAALSMIHLQLGIVMQTLWALRSPASYFKKLITQQHSIL